MQCHRHAYEKENHTTKKQTLGLGPEVLTLSKTEVHTNCGIAWLLVTVVKTEGESQ